MADAITFYAARRKASIGALIGTSGALGVAQAALLAVIGVTALSLIFAGYRDTVMTSAYLFLAIIPLNLATLYLMGILNGVHRYVWFNAIRVLVVLSSALGFAALTLNDQLTVRTAVIAYLCAHVVAIVVAVIGVTRSGATKLEYNGHLARALLGFGVRSHASNVSALLNERLDLLVISILLAPAQLGLYVIAVTLTSATALVGTSASQAALPVIARHEEARDRYEAARRYISVTFLLSTAATVPMLILAPTLIGLLFGSAFRPASDVCRVLLVATVFLSTARVAEAVLKAIGRPLEAGIAETVALLATFAGLALLLPALGLIGAGVASLLAYLVGAAYALVRVASALSVSPLVLLLPLSRRGGFMPVEGRD